MRSYGWATIAITISACLHIAASLWLTNRERKPIRRNKETNGSSLNPPYPMRLVLQYTRSFLKDGFPTQLWKISAAAVWIPFVAACLVLVATLVVLSGLPFFVAGL